MSKNFYNILGVSTSASAKEIKDAYIKLVKEYHPDNHSNNSFYTKRFQEITEAYEVLKDVEKRERYDRAQKNHLKEPMKQSKYEEHDFFKQERDAYINFLNANEKRANFCGKTLSKLKEEAYSIPGILLYSKQVAIQQELDRLERNCRAYDVLMKEFDDFEIRANLCSATVQKSRSKFDGKRGVYSEKEIVEYIRSMHIELCILEKNRKEQLEHLKEELGKKNIDIDAYLESRSLTVSTVSTNAIVTGIKAMELMDKIQLQLLSDGITMDDILKRKGKSFIEVRYKELVQLDETIHRLKQENKKIRIEDIWNMDVESEESIKKNKGL